MQRAEYPMTPAEMDASLAIAAKEAYGDPWTEVDRLVDQGVCNYYEARLRVGVEQIGPGEHTGQTVHAVSARRPAHRRSSNGPQYSEETGVGYERNERGDVVFPSVSPVQAARNSGAIAVATAMLAAKAAEHPADLPAGRPARALSSQELRNRAWADQIRTSLADNTSRSQ